MTGTRWSSRLTVGTDDLIIRREVPDHTKALGAQTNWWSSVDVIPMEELQLAARNHAMPLEALAYDVTPTGLHYLLIHFDIPVVDEAHWALTVDGHAERPLSLTLADIRRRPAKTQAVTMECAGNGRARIASRLKSQPWLDEAVGTGSWTGTELWPLLEEAGVRPEAVEVLFTGLDRGVQGEIEQEYQRSLSLEDARRPEVILAYELNGEALPPQHGFPLRLLVPGWYGMTSVKWLSRITLLARPFSGFQQVTAYTVRATEDDPGRPVSKMMPRSLMIPPGIPDFMTRTRRLGRAGCMLQGRAWSGWAPVTEVAVSLDGGLTWKTAEIGEPVSEHAWVPWRINWTDPVPGEYTLCTRATDAAGNVQPVAPDPGNPQGLANNQVQQVRVIVA